jgi:hypothetical protein
MRITAYPRTDPYVRHSRIRLPPRVSDGKALLRPRVKDARFGEPVVGNLGDPLPRRAVLLAASPEVDDVVVERLQGTAVGRHEL